MTTLPDIPRLYTALAEVLAVLLYAHRLPPRMNQRVIWGVEAGWAVLLGAFLQATGKVPLAWWIPCMAMAILSMLLFLWVTRSITLLEAGYVCARAFILAELAASGAKIADALGGVSPLVWLGEAMVGGNVPALLGSLALLLVPFALVYALLSRSFIGIVTMKRGAAKKKYQERELKTASAGAALVRREAARLTSSAAYMMNAGLGVVFCAAAAAFLIFGRGRVLGIVEAMGLSTDTLTAIAALVIGYFLSTMVFSASSVSLEGKNIWIVRSAPVSSAEILMAKRRLHLLIAVPAALLPAAQLVWHGLCRGRGDIRRNAGQSVRLRGVHGAVCRGVRAGDGRYRTGRESAAPEPDVDQRNAARQAGRGGDPHDAHPDGYASGADAPVHLPALRLGCAAGAGRLRGRVFRSGPAARSLAPDERHPPLRGAGLSLRRKSTNFRAKACEPARYRV